MKRLLRPSVIAVCVGVVALFSLFAYGVSSNQPNQSLDGAVSQGKRVDLPPATLSELSGPATVSLAQFRGHVTVINAWASWCQPCQQEAPLLESWQTRLMPAGGTIVGVDALDLTSDAQAFVTQYHLSYPQLRDNSAAWLKSLGVTGYPETFVLDRQGRLAALSRGPVTDAFLSKVLPPLLNEPA